MIPFIKATLVPRCSCRCRSAPWRTGARNAAIFDRNAGTAAVRTKDAGRMHPRVRFAGEAEIGIDPGLQAILKMCPGERYRGPGGFALSRRVRRWPRPLGRALAQVSRRAPGRLQIVSFSL